MKILHVITSLQIGGAEKLVTEIAPMLRDKGHEVDVCSFVGIGPNLNKVLEENGIKVINFAEDGSVYNPKFIFKLTKLMRNYDIVHTHNTACQMFAAIGSYFCKCKLVTTEHSTSNRRRGKKIFQAIDRWMYGRYKTVICISDKTKTSLEDSLGEKSTKNVVIHNGINIKSYQNAQPLPENEKNTSRFVITMVAGFRYQKDHETAIRAISLLDKQQFELWFVGDGERREVIENYIKECGVAENVRLWGVRNDIPTILKSSDVVLQSSHIEGFGLAAVEGMAVGKPVIATDIPGLAQVVGGAGILVPHKDAEALAKEIEHLANDCAYNQHISDKCLDRAQMFDIGKMVEEYSNVYSEIIAR